MIYPSLLCSDERTIQDVVQIAKLENNPDVLRVKVPDGKSSIGIEQVHALLPQIALKPLKERYKVVIIAPAHLLTQPAQHALLKTIEEPPDDTQIILITPYPTRLLSTIVSRCIRINVPTPATEVANTIPLPRSVGEALQEAHTLGSSREEAIQSLTALLLQLRRTRQNDPETLSRLLKKEKVVISAIKHLSSNVNVKLAVEHTLLACLDVD